MVISTRPSREDCKMSEHELQRSCTSLNGSVRRVMNLYSNNTFRETNSDGIITFWSFTSEQFLHLNEKP